MDSEIKTARGISNTALISTLAAAAMCGLLLGCDSVSSALGFNSGSADTSNYLTELVKKELFEISVNERGQVDSFQNSTLTNKVEGSTTIITIVPEGTRVTKPVTSGVGGIARVQDTASVGQCSVSVIAPIAVPFGVFTPIMTAGLEYEFLKTDRETAIVDDDEYVMTQVTVSDGEFVKANDILIGDVVCELDSSALVDKEKTQQIAVTQAAAALQKARKSVEIQHAQNESDIAAARLAMDLARLALSRYEEGEYVKDLETIQGNIKTLQADLAALEDEYAFYRRTADKGYTPLAQLEKQRIGVKQKRILLEVEKKALRLLADYDREYNLKEKSEAASETVRELGRVRLAGEAALQQFFADVKACELTYTVENSNLERLRRQIDDCRLIAPQAGEVVYANQQSRRSEPVVIEQGVVVRERQAVIKLPDLSKMKVDARIHESKISQVGVGQEVRIRVDAFPDILFEGKIDSVSPIPLPGNWPNTDLKEYEAEIRITSDEKLVRKLKPGLTAGLEIVVKPIRKNVLVIPVQAVLSVGEQYFVYSLTDKGPERRLILVGDSNDQKVEIKDPAAIIDENDTDENGKLSEAEVAPQMKSYFDKLDGNRDKEITLEEMTKFFGEGVKEDDQVIMNPRTHFSDQLAQLETRLASDAKKKKDSDNGVPDSASSGAGGPGKGRSGAGSPSKGGSGKRAPGSGGHGKSSAGKQAAAGGSRRSGGDPDAFIKKYDKDGNGKVSRAEVRPEMHGMFDRLDANKDGEISSEELKQAPPNRGGGGRR